MEYKPPIDPSTAINDSEEECSALAPLKMNPEDYREIWAEYEMSEEQYNEMLGVIWEIAKTFVLMGYNEDISQIMFGNMVSKVSPDSEKLLNIECSKTIEHCAGNDAEKESADEGV
ncbi:hypothetical protein QSV34_10760 [Porticoccus sp. W117]|uniref:hypothetical protein n=1 Tax=Porticoccus sp. W117 TaxID=3054777 RepID=UPI002599CCB9|nr:hypothetical protein [Porticoccus sp. W117]MDM3871830.1 hypothetical protein [Porticoccus sp. W117]